MKKPKINFDIITLFPEVIEPYTRASILGRAKKNNLIKIQAHQLRDYAHDKHQTVDDSPYGGGPGMVLKPEPFFECVDKIKLKNTKLKPNRSRVILLSTRGDLFNQALAQELQKYEQLIFLCGRYEGVDERVATNLADQEISLGNYVLSGGELGALIITDAVSRLIPGVLGKTESLETIKGSYPTYTKPEIFTYKKQKLSIPEVLKSGHHKNIDAWRKNPKDLSKQ